VPGSLVARDISKSYAGEPVLDRVGLRVAPGDRVGIVGPNGIGKSTLLRILAGLEEPDAGSVTATGPVGYLPQEPEAAPGETVLGFLARRTGVAAAERRLEELTARLGDEPEIAGEHATALDELLALGSADFDGRARGVLADVGLADRGGQELASLSGGEAARASLAAILLARFDVFLLDEPTNNLDFDGLERLERFLDGLRAGVVLVSHDRAFLARTVDRIVEFEAETRRVREYTGSWAEYEKARASARTEHERAYDEYAERRDSYTALLRTRRDEARRLGTQQTGRRATNALRGKVRQARHHLERLEVVDKPWSPWELRLELPPAPPAGRIVALDRAVVSRGAFRLGPIDLELHYGDRLGVVGRNGSGKTTLLEALAGTAPLTDGSRTLGPGAAIGELDQARALFEGRLLDDFARLSRLAETEARTLLAKFALGADDVERTVSSLTPGERTRAALALLVAGGVNCLLLDEPTNHLDLEAIEQLEAALGAYTGALVVVSHDRRFLDALALTGRLSL
jgi:ATPase subunit of ABC transporter with duplicated ATPase domains